MLLNLSVLFVSAAANGQLKSQLECPLKGSFLGYSLRAAMSILIPEDWEHLYAFMVEAAKPFGAVSGVFGPFGREAKRSDALDFSEFV
jgi:hypothetical protein